MTNYIPNNSSVLSHINALMSFNLCEWSVVWEEVVVQLYISLRYSETSV